MKQNQIVFNSFPRSGNIYSSTLAYAFFSSMITAVHMPEIFSVKNIDNVTVFRKPEDVIPSLIYKNNRDKPVTDSIIKLQAKSHADLYKVFIKNATESADLIYIGKFEDLISDPVAHFKNVAKKFNKPIFPDYEKKLTDIKSQLVGSLWEDEYDGHIPREKSNQRGRIEEIVKSLPFIQELNKEYKEFIVKYKTVEL